MDKSSTESRIHALKRLTKDEAFVVRLVDYFPQIHSVRELEVVYYILNFYSNNEIAAKLELALQTVKFHNTAIFKRIRVRSRRELLALFYESPSNQKVKREQRIRLDADTQGPQLEIDAEDDKDIVLPFTRSISAENHT